MAQARTSRPASAGGTALIWMGVGSVKPRSRTPRIRMGAMPSSVKASRVAAVAAAGEWVSDTERLRSAGKHTHRFRGGLLRVKSGAMFGRRTEDLPGRLPFGPARAAGARRREGSHETVALSNPHNAERPA